MKLKDLLNLKLNECAFVREGTDLRLTVNGYEILREVLRSCEKYKIKRLGYVIASPANSCPEVTLSSVAFDQVKKYYRMQIED